jgi:hypothetical protein
MQSEGMERDREGLTKKHQQEEAIMREAYASDVDRLSDQSRELRRAKEQQETDLKTEIFKTKSNMSDNFAYQLARERKVNNDQANSSRDAYSMALDGQRERQKEALAEEQERARENFQGFSQGAAARQQARIQRLERQLQDVKNRSTDQSVESKRLHDLEKTHLLASIKNNLDASENQRQMALEDNRQRASRDIKKLVEQNARTLHAMDVSSKEAANMNKGKFDEEVSQVKISLSDQNERLKNQADLRYKQMSENFENNQSVVEENYKGNLEQMKKNYDNALLEIRENSQKERNAVVEHMSKQARAIEQKAFEKMQLQSTSYERQIADLRTKHTKDMTSLRRDNDTRIKNDHSMTEQALANQKLKYETQISEMKETYEKRIREMQQNHEMEKIQAAKSTT